MKISAIKIFISLIAIVWFQIAEATPNAGETLLDQVVGWCKQKNSIEADYTLTAGGESAAGTMVVTGKRFTIKSAIIDIWFDGKTQWTLNPSINETTVTEPTEEELQQVNPFVIIDAFRHAYDVSLMPEQEPSKVQTILLTPKDNSADIRRVEIAVPKGYLYPLRIVLRMSNGETCTLALKRIIRGVEYTDSTFRYDPSTHPSTKVIDMR